MGRDPSVKVLQALGRARALDSDFRNLLYQLGDVVAELDAVLLTLEVALHQHPHFSRLEGPASYAGGSHQAPASGSPEAH